MLFWRSKNRCGAFSFCYDFNGCSFLGFRNSVFDKNVCFEVLEHLDSPIGALHIAFRKKCPQIIIVYPLIRFGDFKSIFGKAKISLETYKYVVLMSNTEKTIEKPYYNATLSMAKNSPHVNML